MGSETGFSGSRFPLLFSVFAPASAPHPPSFGASTCTRPAYYDYLFVCSTYPISSTQPDCRAWAPGHRLGSAHAGWRTPTGDPLALRNHSAPEASKPHKHPKASGRNRKQSTSRSFLSPVNSSKVSKAPSKRRSSHQKMSVPCDTSQAAEKRTTDSSAESRSKQAFKVKDAMLAFLRPILSPKVSKPAGKRPTGLRRDGTNLSPTTGRYRLTREDNFGMSSNPSTGRKAMQQSGNALLRRSTRISKLPERFRPGYT